MHLRKGFFINSMPGITYLHTYGKPIHSYLKNVAHLYSENALLILLLTVPILKLPTYTSICDLYCFPAFFVKCQSLFSSLNLTDWWGWSPPWLIHLQHPFSWPPFSVSSMSYEISFQEMETKNVCTEVHVVSSIQWKVAKKTSQPWKKLLSICTL